MSPLPKVDGEGDERALVESLQSGDEQAFVSLVKMYQAQMLGVALSLVGTRAVAEEVVQESWLGVVRGIDRFDGRSSLRTWLLHIVANRARTTRGKEQRYNVVAYQEPLEDPSRFNAQGAWAAPLPHWSEEVDDRMLARSLTVSVHAAIDRLPDAQKQVVRLRDVLGLPAAEVCRLLSLDEGHQRVLLHRGRVAVRRAVEAERKEVGP